MNVKKDIFWRVYLSFLLVLIMAVAIFVKSFRIQQIEGQYWREKAESLTTAFVNIEPVRGNIYAQDGSLMAASLPVYEIRMDLNADALTEKLFFDQIDSLSISLANFFGDKSARAYRHELVSARENGARYHLVRRRVTHNQLREISNFPIFREGRFGGGFIVEQRNIRIKPFQLLAERTIGYKVKDVRPVGLEGAYDEFLSGRKGMRLMQRVSGGAWIPINAENEMEPKDGYDIITTIDMNIQDITEHALLRSLQRHNAAHGSAVVMEVKTGHIKAIANLGKGADGRYREDYNYAIGESTEPGSTFKLASMMLLLDNGLATADDLVDTRDGSIEYFDRVMRDHIEDGFGEITLQRAFELSSNVAISRIIYENYYNKQSEFIEELKKRKLHLPLGIPIAGEGAPLIKDPKDSDWSGTTLPWMSIGYEMRMTPLQILTLYNAVANNGKMVKPLFVTEVHDVGKPVDRFQTEVIHNRIASASTIKALQDMLIGVVDSGTASNIKSPHYSIAGKTGTALVASAGSYRSEEGKHYQASFAGYFPADNPKYSIIVVISNPSAGIFYGSRVAAPVFKEISDKLFANNINLHQIVSKPEKETVEPNLLSTISPGSLNDMQYLLEYHKMPFFINTGNNVWRHLVMTDTLIVVSEKEMIPKSVPDVRGMVLTDAVYLLETEGLKVSVSGNGRVSRQSITPGTIITQGRAINLILN